MKIIFRTNAGREGLGHLNRVYAIYTALAKIEHFDGLFLVNDLARKSLINWNVPNVKIITSEDYNAKDIGLLKKHNPDIIIIDTYKASEDYFISIGKELSLIIVLFDDNIQYNNIEIDILINGNIFANKLKYDNRIKFQKALLGPKYLVMNPDFWKKEKKKELPSNISNILITCGGSDPKNIMLQFIKWLKHEDLIKKVVIGPYFEEEKIKNIKCIIDDSFELIDKPIGLKQHIENSDIILTASGSTVYEVLSLNKIPIIFCIGNDQILISEELEKLGVINLGWFDRIDQNMLKIAINKSKDENYRLTLKKIFSLFDRRGTSRVAKEIVSYYKTLNNREK